MECPKCKQTVSRSQEDGFVLLECGSCDWYSQQRNPSDETEE